MQELIERLENASGPDRDLDAEIFRAIGAPLPDTLGAAKFALEWDDKERCFIAPLPEGMRVRYEHPAYTRSLDDALRLVPDRHRWLLDRRPGADHREDGYRAEVYRESHPYKSDKSDMPQAWCATPAIALSTAAMKARGHQQSKDLAK